MTRSLVIAKKKPQYAPIVDAVQRTGLPIVDFEDDLSGFDQLIVFHNKYFEPLKTDAKVGWWMCDYRKPYELVAQPQRNADHIFLPYLNYHKWYADHFGVPVTFMPQHGVEWPFAMHPRPINCDAVFIGNVADDSPYHYNRSRVLQEISRFCRLEHIRGERTTRDMRSIYRQVPISINITPPGMAGSSNRLYNILSSGGLCLTTWFEGIEQLFENEKHLVWFKEPHELMPLIEKALTNTRWNQRIRTQGEQLYRTHHTAQHRLDNMFDILSGTETDFRGYLK